MNGPSANDPAGVRLNEAGVGRAASDLLMASSERRKRGRPPTVPDRGVEGGVPNPGGYAHRNAAEPDRKRRHVGPGGSANVNVGAAKRAAAALLRESPTYKRLIDVEEHIDLAIMRKQQDIKDALKNNNYTRTCTFRLYILNTFRSQPRDPDGSESSPSSRTNDARDGEDRGDDKDGSGIDDGRKDGDDKDEAGGDPDLEVPSWSLRLQGHFVDVEEPVAASSAAKPGVVGDAKDGSSTPAAGGGAAASSADGGEGQARFHSQAAGVTGAGGSNPGAPYSGGNAQQTPPRNSAGPPGAPGTATPTPLAPNLRPPTHLKCTDVFRRVVVELEKDSGGDKNLIEWNRVPGEPSADGFELSRSGDKECKARIFLYVDNSPARFKLSQVLSRLVGVRNDTRTNVFMSVWEYIKKKKLQCDGDRASVRVDPGLRTVLPASHATAETVKLNQLFEVVKLHMGPQDPIQLEYTIKLSGNVVENQACYDIQVEVPDETLHESAVSCGIFGVSYPNSADFMSLNEKHMEALELVAYHKRRRNFLEEFCASPVDFINRLILSQTRDLKVINGSSGRNPEEERWASFYQQQWVNEAVPRYLLRKQIADAAKKTAEQPRPT